MFDANAATVADANVLSFDRTTDAGKSGTPAPALAWPNPRHPLAFQLAMALVEQSEYDAA